MPVRWRGGRLASVLLAAALLADPVEVDAAAWDPAWHWSTIETQHWRITFHQGEETLAAEVAGLVDPLWERVTASLGTRPARKVELVLVDPTDSANGYATRLPVNTIVVFVTLPDDEGTLSLYRDWNEAILTHELTHIVHLDTVGGAPRILALILGRLISVNQVSPRWLVEGLAVWNETELTPFGRGRSPYADMIKRMEVLEVGVPRLGNLEGWQSDPPYGNLAYLFGEDFVRFVADTAGPDTLRDWVHVYGRWPLPYVLPARRVFGRSWTALYRDWKQALEERYAARAAEVAVEGLTGGRRVSDGKDNCGAPEFSPDGTMLVWGCSDKGRGSGTFLADGDGLGARKVLDDVNSRSYAWRGDSRAFAYTVRRNDILWHDVNDVRLYLLDEDRVEVLTDEARARDPAFSPDGRDLLVVTNHIQETRLSRLGVDRRLVDVDAPGGHAQHATPCFSPDGRWVALSLWSEGSRDLWIYRADGTPLARLTHDDALDRDPAWSPDGRTLFFSSDRSGIYDIYAVDLADGRLWQVTRVLGGAFDPTIRPDGKVMAWVDYHAHGADIRISPLDRATWKEIGTLDTRGVLEGAATSGPSVSEAEPVPSEPPAAPSATAPEARPYRPLPTLLPPRYVMPSLYVTEVGALGVLSTGGHDLLQRYRYGGYVTYRTDNRFVGGGGSFTLNRWRTVLTTGAYVNTIRYGRIWVETHPPPEGGATIPGIERGDDTYYDRRIRFYAQAGYPITPHQVMAFTVDGEMRDSLRDLPPDVHLGTLPARGYLSSLAIGWRHARSRSYAHSISPEEARQVTATAQYTASWLGSHLLDDSGEPVPFDQVQVTSEWREYTSLPWAANHVLALRAAAGVSLGDGLRYGSFRLGGSYGEGALYALPDEYRALRGFPVASVYGDWYYLGGAEYRLPIWRIDRGFGNLPFFLRTLHAALLCDVGNAFAAFPSSGAEAADLLGATRVGVGAELRLGMVVGWGYGFTGRLGYAFGASGEGGIRAGSLDGLYLQMGNSF
ncbi:MAG: PD40 domain-containing protein [Deltaproteobacteria bacterium]|nr:PD40 domain-containing protein [Deltaproteobacteria bacterium]